jgi:hypothetical protein
MQRRTKPGVWNNAGGHSVVTYVGSKPRASEVNDGCLGGVNVAEPLPVDRSNDIRDNKPPPDGGLL